MLLNQFYKQPFKKRLSQNNKDLEKGPSANKVVKVEPKQRINTFLKLFTKVLFSIEAI